MKTAKYFSGRIFTIMQISYHLIFCPDLLHVFTIRRFFMFTDPSSCGRNTFTATWQARDTISY